MIRKMPTILAGLFISLTLSRVAEFSGNRMNAGWLGWLFAAGLGAGLFFVGYWTRDSITAKEDGKQDKRAVNVKSWAWGVLVTLVVVDGLFNLAEVWQSVKPPEFDTDRLFVITTAMYGAFPTIVAALLGVLQGHIDRLPKPPTKAALSFGNLTTAALNYFTAMFTVRTERLSKPDVKPDVKPASAETVAPVKANLTGVKLELVKVIKSNPNLTQGDIAEKIGRSRQWVNTTLKEPAVMTALNGNGKVH